MTAPRLQPIHFKGLAIIAVILSIVGIVSVGRHSQAACATMPTDKGTITVSAAVPSSGTYHVWSRNRAALSINNAYYLQVDSDCGVKVGDTLIPANTWTWVNYKDGNTANRISVNLTAGSHNFKFYGSDPSVQVDRLVLTADSNCTPTGLGDNCTNGNSTPPVVVTTPGTTGPTVVGTVQVGSNNPDSKTTVKVDGKLVTNGSGLVEVDTSKLSDGFHDITIEITNPDGTVQTVTKRILVQNNLPFWQKGYNQLYKALNYNKLLTNIVVLIAGAVILGAVGTAIFIGWSRRIWEKLPIIKKIHIPFLHTPAFLSKLFGNKAPAGPHAVLAEGTVVSNVNWKHQPARFSFKLAGHKFSPNIPAIATIAAFAIIGSAALLYSSAAANGFIVEPEAGVKAGVTVLTDSSAAGGSYVLFGTGTCPAGQTGTPPNCVTPPATCPAGQTGTPPNCVTPPTNPPPTSGNQPTRANTGPRYSMTNMTPQQFYDSRTCNRQKITGDIRFDQAWMKGQTFNLTDCEVERVVVYINGGGSILQLNEMPIINMDYVDINDSIQTLNAAKFNVNHSYINNGVQLVLKDYWAPFISGPAPYNFSNTAIYGPYATQPSHTEAMHVADYGSGYRFTNVAFIQQGGSVNNSGVTAVINFHGNDTIFDGCWFLWDGPAPTYHTVYIDGSNTIVRNSWFDSGAGYVYPSSETMATYQNNRNVDTRALLTLP